MLTMQWTSLFLTILLSICISCHSVEDDGKGWTGLNDRESQTTRSLRRFLQGTCMVEKNTQLCTGLTANQAPVAGCDCYNYCGSEYAGCCTIEDPNCSVNCTSLSAGEVLTAGCQLQILPPAVPSPPTPPPPTSAPVVQAGVCLIERNTELCPGLLATQSPLEGCDCYNYCGSEYMGCCEFGGGCTVSCPSLITGEVLTAGCQLPADAQPVTTPPVEPTPSPIVPGPLCAAELNTELCPELTANQEPVEGCGCYNYCGSDYAGCSPFGASGTTMCSSLSGVEVLTAGCRLPATPPAPTVAPVEQPGFCLLEQNTQNCPLLIQNQSPVEDCDCYNYCGGTYVGCCQSDAGCFVSCPILNFGEVLTAGCALRINPPTNCKTFGSECIESTDCCSARCLFGSCQTPRSRTDTRQKLSSGRGGAGGLAKATRVDPIGPGVRRRATIRGE